MFKIKDNLVSVVIPTYNRGEKIIDTIKSVLDQTYQDIEIIVVDDYSPNNPEKIIAKINNPKIRFIRLKQNSGAPTARNRGLSEAKGEFIAFLDDDDSWDSNKLELQLKIFQNVGKKIGLVYSGYTVYINNKESTEIIPIYRNNAVIPLLSRNIIGSPTPLIRTEIVKQIGGFDPNFKSSQDWDTWLRIAEITNFEFIPKSLARYNIHRNQITGNPKKIIQGRELFLRKHYKRLKNHKAIYANHCFEIGNLFFLRNEKNQALKYYSEGIRNNLINIYYLNLIMGIIFPKIFKRFIGIYNYKYSFIEILIKKVKKSLFP